MTKKKKKSQKEYSFFLFSSVIVCLTAILLNYIIFETDIIKPKLNETTMSYITFNNRDTTDMLKIKNIKKMADQKGKSFRNNSRIRLKAKGEKNTEYIVVLYPITNNIEENNIKYLLKKRQEKISNSLNNLQNTQDGGKILYEGKIDNQEIDIQLWISKDYSEKINENSFEIKIKPR